MAIKFPIAAQVGRARMKTGALCRSVLHAGFDHAESQGAQRLRRFETESPGCGRKPMRIAAQT